jgi:hypothetical protein
MALGEFEICAFCSYWSGPTNGSVVKKETVAMVRSDLP